MNMPIPMVKKPLLPTAEQQRVLARIAAQRERLAARRSQRSQSLAAAVRTGQGALPETLVLRQAGSAFALTRRELLQDWRGIKEQL